MSAVSGYVIFIVVRTISIRCFCLMFPRQHAFHVPCGATQHASQYLHVSSKWFCDFYWCKGKRLFWCIVIVWCLPMDDMLQRFLRLAMKVDFHIANVFAHCCRRVFMFHVLRRTFQELPCKQLGSVSYIPRSMDMSWMLQQIVCFSYDRTTSKMLQANKNMLQAEV
jgi:hypothetical protein